MNQNKDHDKLVEILKFTPRTYKISLWGYGGESVMGTVRREVYDYFKKRRLDLTTFAWDDDYATEHDIPEEFWPFPPGSWYECDDIAHTNGVDRGSCTICIQDENGNTVLEQSLDFFSDQEDCPEFEFGDEHYIDGQPEGTVVFIGNSNEKGTFFESEFEIKSPFDINKVTLLVDEVDGNEYIYGVTYDGDDVENYGGSTDGKSSDFGFYIAGSLKNGKWEKYKDLDDCSYEMTDWFPKKINPIRNGVYEIDTGVKNKWPNFSPTTAKWTGTRWISVWSDDSQNAEEVKVKQWRGIASDPDL